MPEAALTDWIAREAIPFSLESDGSLNAAVAHLIAALGTKVELLGLGEPMHGGEEFLVLRNRMFQRLAERHGYTAIAIESSFPRGAAIRDYINGGSSTFSSVRDAGFSHSFGKLDTTRELIEWMHTYNADPSHATKLRFDGFDSPTEMTHTDSPRQLLRFALNYLTSIGFPAIGERRERIEALLGADANWENPAAMMDLAKSVGLSPAAVSLRIETENLITELRLLAPDHPDERRREAERYATLARQMLTYHAGLATASDDRIAKLLGQRDLMMADNLAYIVERERRRDGKVFVFAHNSHLQRGQAKWQLGPHALAWWPAGAQVHEMLGQRYAVIGSGLGMSEQNGIGQPEPGTLEAKLTASTEPARFIPTRRIGETAGLPTRSSSSKNHSYFPLTEQSLTDFDALAILNSVTYSRGGPALP